LIPIQLLSGGVAPLDVPSQAIQLAADLKMPATREATTQNNTHKD